MIEPTVKTDTEVTVTDDLTAGGPRADASTPLVESDLLVEDVSIDGMCGVY